MRARIRTLAIPDRFVVHMSSRDEQLAEAGLDASAIERSLRSLLSSNASASRSSPEG
jgi:deoxyxylulose-5-phosphate synthase